MSRANGRFEDREPAHESVDGRRDGGGARCRLVESAQGLPARQNSVIAYRATTNLPITITDERSL
jgi:hypothetical protein